MQIFNLKCLLDRFRLLKLENKFAMHVTFQDRQIRFPFFFLADAKVATNAVNQCWQRGRSWKYAPLHIWVFALDSISDCIFRVVVIIKGKIMHSLRHNWAWTLNTWQQISIAFANLFPFFFKSTSEWWIWVSARRKRKLLLLIPDGLECAKLLLLLWMRSNKSEGEIESKSPLKA